MVDGGKENDKGRQRKDEKRGNENMLGRGNERRMMGKMIKERESKGRTARCKDGGGVDESEVCVG